MAYSLFSRVVLRENFPEYQLYKGDVATVVEQHKGKQGKEMGYSLEVFNAVGDTIAVIVAEESKIEPLRKNEMLHVRQLAEAAYY